MSKIAIFFAEGYEEVEALAVVDICRRAGIETDMVSVTEESMVTSSHGISVKTDKTFGEVNFEEYDMLVLPGGGKGTQGLEAHEGLMAQIDAFYEKGKYIAAICAAPSIFGHRGILKGRNACSYPSFESHLEGARVTKGPVEISDHVITSRGMGTAIDFGLAIAGALCGKEEAEKLARQIVYREA
ncbi:MAG: DJ-1/PfpI family protein [Bacteroidales bacterium]|nr:DJ-1/PfpI family protein [Lachnoclostridium sp.]MCM1383359.1 DJ-1/PfpI family protein [Lachnoclostridium sp.]MCM1465024.1 DJ-1/PfpI family protein [Bacteroidales bacterium]